MTECQKKWRDKPLYAPNRKDISRNGSSPNVFASLVVVPFLNSFANNNIMETETLSEEAKRRKERNEKIRHFIAGTFAGMAGVFVGHPFDTIKVRLQTMSYRNPFHCFAQTLRFEGVRGLYKGLSSPLLGDSLTNSIVFGVYGLTRRAQLAEGQTEEHFDLLSLSQICWAGAAVGVAAGVFLAPVELVKIRLQVQTASEKRIYAGPVDCLRKILKSDGPMGLMRGLFATWWRDIPGFAAYFVSYEWLRRTMTPVGHSLDELPPLKQLLAGGLGGIAAWVISYPFDVLKSRIQTNNEYRGLWHCAMASYRNEGARVFFAGLGTTIVRSFPVNAVIFLVYQVLARVLPT
jgi:solute carrier family 25 carnitine/acylcarnitine transporter 20/29